VETLYPQRGGVREALDDVPFGPSGFARVLEPHQFDKSGRLVKRRKHLKASRAVDACAEAWAELLEEAIATLGANTVRKRLKPMEIVVAGGFTYFARFLGERGMSKAEAKRYLGAWEDELTQTP
jgi:hypothetical protein